MPKTRASWAAVAVAAFYACGGSPAPVHVQPEEPATLHVGEIAAVHLPSEHYHMTGSAGGSLVLVKQTQQQDTSIYFYRAVEIGEQTLVATPRDPGPGGCVSCVTVRYFIKVMQ